MLSRRLREAISDSSGRHSRREGPSCSLLLHHLLQSHCSINCFSCQPSLCSKTLGLGPGREGFLVFSWDTRHLQCLGSSSPLPTRHIPAALEQLWILGAHTCTLLIVWSKGFSQRSCTSGMRAVNVSCRSGHSAPAVTCRQVNTPTVIHPKIPPTSWFLAGKCGTSGMVWRHGTKLFSGSLDSKCLRKQGIQVERSWLHIKNKAVSKVPWEIWTNGSACCISSVIKHCASVPQPTVSLIYCNTWISECLNDKFSEYISTEKADWQIASQTTRKAWHAEWGCCNRSCLNTVSIPARHAGLGFLNGTALHFPWTSVQNLYL